MIVENKLAGKFKGRNALKRLETPVFKTIGVIALVLMPTLASAQSLGTVLEKSVYAHPEYRSLTSNRSAIGEEYNAARGLGLPGVNIEASQGSINDDNTNQSHRKWSVVLNQPLYDGGKTVSEVSRQTQRLQSADQRVQDTSNTIGLQIVQAYLEVQRSRRVLSLARSNEHAIRAIVNRVGKRVSGGSATQADKELALSRLYAAQNITAESEVRAEDANALYITLVGEKPGKLKQVKLNKAGFPRTRSEAVSLGKMSSPRILAMRHDALASEFAIDSAKSAILPKLDLELSANHNGRIDGTNAENTSYKAMLVFRMSLYNGGINAARIREAEHRAQEAAELTDAAVLNVEREIRLSWNTFKGAPKKVRALDSQAASSLRLRKLREKQYDAGNSTLISILDAQNEYIISKVQAVNEGSMRKFAYFKILAASGRLVESFGIDRETSEVDDIIVHSAIPTKAIRTFSIDTAELQTSQVETVSAVKRPRIKRDHRRNFLNEKGR